MNRPLLLIGHRASGKSTLGRALALGLHCPFIDLDDMIEREQGQSAAALVEANEPAFRAMEIDALHRLREAGDFAVIAAGGGLREIPGDVFVIWIYREGWESDALASRRRLRPDLAPEGEIAWMRESREERFRRAAHIKLHIERGASIEQAGTRLLLLVRWLFAAVASPVLQRSWMRPRDADDLERCAQQARLFGMAGVELRSDMFSTLPSLDVPVMASLRSDDEHFLAGADAAACLDCDATLLRHLRLDALRPRPLVLSTHPDDVYKEFFDHLVSLPAYIERAFPAWASMLTLKYAPRVKSWVELRYANQLYKVYEKAGKHIDFFPQGKRWHWMRVQRLFRGNSLNFISSGCEEFSQLPPSLDYFLPHAQQPAPEFFLALIGGQAERSVGDVFHRAVSLEQDGGKDCYVRISLNSTEIDNCLHLLPQLGFTGVSVTSPLKRAVVQSNFTGCDRPLEAGNTLALIKGSFMLFDTDEEGFARELLELEARLPGRAPVLLFGDGGVTDALRRALAARGWTDVRVLPARDGWASAPATRVDVVVNASGGNASAGAPECVAWIDIRYRDVDAPPPGVRLLRNGMTMYKHQALAQRRLWGLRGEETDFVSSF